MVYVTMPIVITHSVVILNILMLYVVMPSVIKLYTYAKVPWA